MPRSQSPQTENGERGRIWKPTVRSQKFAGSNGREQEAVTDGSAATVEGGALAARVGGEQRGRRTAELRQPGEGERRAARERA